MLEVNTKLGDNISLVKSTVMVGVISILGVITGLDCRNDIVVSTSAILEVNTKLDDNISLVKSTEIGVLIIGTTSVLVGIISVIDVKVAKVLSAVNTEVNDVNLLTLMIIVGTLSMVDNNAVGLDNSVVGLNSATSEVNKNEGIGVVLIAEITDVTAAVVVVGKTSMVDNIVAIETLVISAMLDSETVGDISIEVSNCIVLMNSISVLDIVGTISILVLIKISVLDSMGDTVVRLDVAPTVKSSLGDVLTEPKLNSMLEVTAGVGIGNILVKSLATPLVIIVEGIIKLDVGVIINSMLDEVIVAMMLSVKVGGIVAFVKSISPLVVSVVMTVSAVDRVVSVISVGERKDDCDIMLVVIVGIVIISEALMTTVEVNGVMLLFSKLVAITLEVAV